MLGPAFGEPLAYPLPEMDPIAVTAASGLRARMDALDVLANNIANAGTKGYKGDRELYNLYFGRSLRHPGGPAALPVIEGKWTDFSQGLLQTTANPFDLALRGEGFFAVDGPSGVLYTRNGSFEISDGGALQTAEGYAVRLEDGRQLRLESGFPVEVSKDGTIRQQGRVLGQLEVVQFEDASVLGKQGKMYYRVDAAGATPVEAAGTEVLQGTTEASNVSTSETAVRIVSVMRQFEMLQKAITVARDMDRQVISEVAKVGP